VTNAHATPAEGSGFEEPPHIQNVDESVFPLDVVLKATYWMTGRYDVDIQRDEARGYLRVLIRGLAGPLAAAEVLEAGRRLRRDLIDFRTRMLIDHETRVIRELLVAKAFDDDIDSQTLLPSTLL
jgi:His-Xaa-Ser system protein HxsD